jgi:1-acyl-sn-glycerol-3-phosphate acyltransferase
MASDGVARFSENEALAAAPVPPRLVEVLWRNVALWRVLATGLCFAVFGIGQLLLAITAFPLLVLLVRDRPRRERLGRRIIQLAFRGFLLLMRATGGLQYRVRGLEKLRQPGTVILANHPSLIDVVFLVSLVPDVDCVIKPSLFKNPFTRYAVMAAGYIPSRDPEEVLRACRSSLSSGGCLLVFPEGTRTDPRQPLHLQRGAANLAIRSGCDMVPVIIRASEHNLGKGACWWRMPGKTVTFDFEVKDRLDVSPWLDSGHEPAISARELTAWLTDYFRREIETPCPSWPKS